MTPDHKPPPLLSQTARGAGGPDHHADAWRTVTQELEAALRTRLISLVAGELLLLETANEILQACGLPPLDPTEKADRTDPDCDSEEPAVRFGANLEHPVVGSGTVTTNPVRGWERARYLRQVRQIRTALMTALYHGGIDSRPGAHGPYAMIDDLLRGLGLPELPRAHLYEVTATIPTTVSATSVADARIAAYRLLRDVSATTPQYGMPVTVAETFQEPDIMADGTDRFRVVWHATYLVCLRGSIPARRLAEAAVRIQLSVLADEVPGVIEAPLRIDYLGDHADHCLDPYRD